MIARLASLALGVALALSAVPALAEQLRSRGLRVTRLARGVPVGSELEYVDLGTIAHAFMDRR